MLLEGKKYLNDNTKLCNKYHWLLKDSAISCSICFILSDTFANMSSLNLGVYLIIVHSEQAMLLHEIAFSPTEHSLDE